MSRTQALCRVTGDAEVTRERAERTPEINARLRLVAKADYPELEVEHHPGVRRERERENTHPTSRSCYRRKRGKRERSPARESTFHLITRLRRLEEDGGAEGGEGGSRAVSPALIELENGIKLTISSEWPDFYDPGNYL